MHIEIHTLKLNQIRVGWSANYNTIMYCIFHLHRWLCRWWDEDMFVEQTIRQECHPIGMDLGIEDEPFMMYFSSIR